MKSCFPSLVLLTMLPATVWGQSPAGAEFQVNTYTTNNQYNPSVAVDGSGNFVVVWRSYQDGNGSGVFGRRFNAAGLPLGSEFRVNTYTTGSQDFPAVASDANGNFVVVWNSAGQDGSGSGVFGRRFNASGVPQASEFQVNSYTTSYQSNAAVTSDASGNFVVVWRNTASQDGGYSGIFAQRFDPSGNRLGAEFQVNSYTTGNQLRPAISSDASGDFVVVWDSNAGTGSGYGIFGQRFNGSGAAQGNEFQVNSYTTGEQLISAVASDAGGGFVVSWVSVGQDGDIAGIFGRRFDASGTPQGSDFQVNSYTTSLQSLMRVASDENGNFVVVWNSFGQEGNNYGVFGQRFNASGVRQGAEFQINSYTTGRQSVAAVAASPDGDFVVVWSSAAQDGDSYGIFGQRYGDLIFEDGFDSGDLTRWSTSATDGGNLTASGAAAMAGTPFGLEAFVNDPTALYVEDDTPAGENRYRVRFYFDPNGFDPGEAQSHFRTRIFIAFDDGGFRIATLVLKRQLGAYTVEGRVRRNDGTRADTGFFPITDGPHFIEFDWQRASAPGAMDGSFTLRIDDALVSSLINIDNDASPVGFARLGALSIKTGAAGTLYYDQFESRRQNPIGAE